LLPWGPVGGRQAIAAHRQDFAGLKHMAWIVLPRCRTTWSDDMTTIFRRALLMSALIHGTAFGQQFQDNLMIDRAVATALVGTGLNALPVDNRLKLARCPEPLTVNAPALGSIAVHCHRLGWRVRVLIDGAAATVTMAPVVIKRGDPVSVNFVAPGFSVTTSGIAESDARIGERVRVRVEQKANPVMGEVTDAGSVRVGALN
jgi:flagellar basal body P-ring formation protein FlgA